MLKKSIIKIFFFCLLLAFVSSCKKKVELCDCFDAAGPQASENRTPLLSYFDQIYVDDNINVFLSNGPSERVIIEGGNNLIKNISARVSNNVLTLKNENICNWLRSYKKSVINVYITMPKIKFVTNNGVGTIQSTDTLACDSLGIDALSAGDITLTINCKTLLIYMFGSSNLTLNGYCGAFNCSNSGGTGFVHCSQLLSEYVYMLSSSTGDCYVNSTGQLDVFIYKNGNVYYTGNPNPIHKKIYGSGQLIKE